MPKYAQVHARDLITVLKKHGFIEHSRKGSHVTLKNSTTQKRTTIPVHNRPLGRGLLSAILRQVELSKSILDEK